MSTMNETLQNESLFIPSEDTTTTTDRPKYIPKVAGEYLGHMTDVRITDTEWTDKKTGNNFKARIYNFKVLVADENKAMTYTTDRGSHDGTSYIGWKAVGDGVFRFLEPKDGDTFTSNSAGNDKYLRFCQSLGMSVETTKREVNGKSVEVSVLPSLETKDIEGLPVTAVVNRHKEDWVYSDGKSMPQWRVKFIKEWRDGKRLEKDGLPF